MSFEGERMKRVRREAAARVAAQRENQVQLCRPDGGGCPQCGGEGALLGEMGRLIHLRCRQCGWTYSMLNNAEG